ncbi:hypothetical protein ACFY4C_40155 [Actinomadura viridis]|uniref:hypothetical protein n=1 Tax=Actinomadura viridis TaxID=58110 RepID=UPI00367CD207
MADLGTLLLRAVRTSGQVLLLAHDEVRSGHVRVEGLTVEAADVRRRVERPHGFGVDALQGAFTLWNRQPDNAVAITAELLDVAAGSADRPVRGSGVFVGGHGDWNGAADGGTARVSMLRTGPDAAGPVRDHRCGGGPGLHPAPVVQHHVVLAVGGDRAGDDHLVHHGAGDDEHPSADQVRRVGRDTAVGVDLSSTSATSAGWTCGHRSPPTAPERGFNLDDGSLRHASFDSIATTGDGAIGIQISKELPRLEVRGDLTTSGGTGTSLVRGVQSQLQAVALSIKPGGRVGQAAVGGHIATRGDHLVTVDIDGELGDLRADGGIHAEGRGSDVVRLKGDGIDLTGVEATAVDGQVIVRRQT